MSGISRRCDASSSRPFVERTLRLRRSSKINEVSEFPAKNSVRSERSVEELSRASRSSAPYSATLHDCLVDDVDAEMTDSAFSDELDSEAATEAASEVDGVADCMAAIAALSWSSVKFAVCP